jgi:hypothetical protein
MYKVHKPSNFVLYKKKKTAWPEFASELYRTSDRRLLAKLMPTFAVRGCCVIRTTDPYGRILGFLDRSRYFVFQAALQFYYAAEWTPFQIHYFSENLVAPGIEPGTSGPIARNSDH